MTQPFPTDRFDVPTLVKTLMYQGGPAMLATLTPDHFPFNSLVTYANDIDGSPLLLLSNLAHHTQHLLLQPQASLLIARSGKGDPLAHPRLTLIGSCHQITAVEKSNSRQCFLNRNPKAELYIDFADFSLWRFVVTKAFLNGGFGKAVELEAYQL